MLIDIKKDRSENVKYDYPDFPIYIRRSFLSIFPNYSADSHWHDDIELIVVMSGEMQYNINGEIVTLHTGEGIMVNQKQLHFGYSDAKQECDYICILFHPTLLCTASIEDDYLSQVLESGIPYFHLSFKIEWQRKILKYIEDICEKKEESFAKLYAQGKLCLLWTELLTRAVKSPAVPIPDNNLTAIKDMIRFMHEHYREKISLDDIANAGYVSKRTCGTIFLKYQGKTPIEFLTDYRLRKSIEQMKNNDMSILEIALSVGFSGASYYAETFRKMFGQSPAEYRKAMNEKKTK